MPYAVGLYITAAYWFTSSTSFANPAVTIARRCPTPSPASARRRAGLHRRAAGRRRARDLAVRLAAAAGRRHRFRGTARGRAQPLAPASNRSISVFPGLSNHDSFVTSTISDRTNRPTGRRTMRECRSWSRSAGDSSSRAAARPRLAPLPPQWRRAGRAKATPALARGRLSVEPARQRQPSSRSISPSTSPIRTPDSPGVLLKLGRPAEGGVGPGRRHRRLLDPLPAQGLSAALRRRRRVAELPRPLLALRCREGRACRSGARRPRTCRSSRCGSTTRATSTPRAWTS